jgi:hypothetical protein
VLHRCDVTMNAAGTVGYGKMHPVVC